MNPTTLAGMVKKRGYSREFRPHGDTGKRYLLDDIPAGLWRDVKEKSKREGVSIRALILKLLTEWLGRNEPIGDTAKSVDNASVSVAGTSESPQDSEASLSDLKALVTSQRQEIAQLRERAAMFGGRLCEMLTILGGDESDLGPTLARDRMDEIARWRQRAKQAESHVAQLTQELIEMRAKHPEAGCYDALPQLRAQLSRLQAYVRHQPGCDTNVLLKNRCTCGLDHALNGTVTQDN